MNEDDRVTNERVSGHFCIVFLFKPILICQKYIFTFRVIKKSETNQFHWYTSLISFLYRNDFIPTRWISFKRLYIKMWSLEMYHLSDIESEIKCVSRNRRRRIVSFFTLNLQHETVDTRESLNEFFIHLRWDNNVIHAIINTKSEKQGERIKRAWIG